MNRFVAATLFGALLFCGACETRAYGYEVNSEKTLQRKYGRAKRKKIVGLSLLGTGATMATTGIVLMATASWSTSSYGGRVSVNTSDPQGGVGLLLTIPGVPLTVVGTVMAAVGVKRQRYYGRMIEFSSLSPAIAKDRAGLVLHGTF